MIEVATLLGTAAGLGAGAGINSYATLFVFGLVGRFYPALFPGDLASFFSTTPVLVVLGVLYLVEFVADKVPAIDHLWDMIHTLIRPAAGAFVAFAAAGQELPQAWVILATVIAGGSALTTHAGKASLRATSTATTGGVGNPFLSLIEDILAILGVIVAIFAPLIILTVIGLTLIVIAIFFGRRRFAAPRASA
jgi:hypothetical protein